MDELLQRVEAFIRTHVDEILREAQPGLAAQGCTVADLF